AIQPKLGTLLNLAICHERQGRTATSWAELTLAIDQARQRRRRDHETFARQHLAALSAQLSLVVPQWQRPAPHPTFEIDDVPMGEAAVGTALPLDPGEHRVRVSAPGRLAWEQTITVGRGPVTRTLAIPELAVDRPAPPAPIARAPA